MIALHKDASDLHTDPAHGRPLPKGRPLHQVLARILDRQRLAVLDWVRSLREIPRHAPSLARWTEPMATATAPPIESYQRQGARQLLGEILRALASRRSTQRGHTPARRKSPAEPTTVEQILADAFRVFNAEVAEAARHAAFAFCQATNQTATNVLALAVRDARNDLAEGLEKGEALARLTARVQRSFSDPLRAARIAATESSRAVHAGQQQVALATGGLVSHKTWLASSDACELCLSLNGLSVPVNQHFVVAGGSGPYAVVEHPPAHPHCLLPGNRIFPAVASAVMTARYDGSACRIHFRNGGEVTVTANHLLLTRSGFLPAGALVQGDQVIRYGMGEGNPGVNPHDYGKPVLIEEMVRAFSVAPGVTTTSVPAAPEYLHGDAASCHGNIDIVTSDRLLGYDFNSGLAKPVDELPFVGTFDFRLPLDGRRDLAAVLVALRDATDGGVRRFRELKALLLCGLRHADQVSLAEGPRSNVVSEEDIPNARPGDIEVQGDGLLCFPGGVSRENGDFVKLLSRPANTSLWSHWDSCLLEAVVDEPWSDTERIGNLCRRFPGQVSFCDVEDVEIFHYNGPVFDATAPSTLYLVGNGIVSSNCMCALTFEVDL